MMILMRTMDLKVVPRDVDEFLLDLDWMTLGLYGIDEESEVKSLNLEMMRKN